MQDAQLRCEPRLEFLVSGRVSEHWPPTRENLLAKGMGIIMEPP